MNATKLANVIRDLIVNYDRACKNPTIRNPIANALYMTWRKYDD